MNLKKLQQFAFTFLTLSSIIMGNVYSHATFEKKTLSSGWSAPVGTTIDGVMGEYTTDATGKFFFRGSCYYVPNEKCLQVVKKGEVVITVCTDMLEIPDGTTYTTYEVQNDNLVIVDKGVKKTPDVTK